MNELSTANQLMAQLYNIESYESLDVSKELDIHKLLKAKEYFTQNMALFGQLKADYKTQVIRAEANYQFTRASEKVKFMEMGDSATKAEAKANCSQSFMDAKNDYADISGKHEEAKANHELCSKRIDAIQQHISVLQKELDKNQFIKG